MSHDIYGAVGAPVYHRLTAGDVTEVPELRRLLRDVQGPVLELACGSGRLTFPLLAMGLRVTALDRSPAMVEILGDAVAGSPALRRMAGRLTALVGDMSGFAFQERFDAIVLGTTSITLLGASERALCFTCVRRHLADGGRFLVSVLDVAGPARDTLSELPSGTLHERVDPQAGRRWMTVKVDGDVLTSAPHLLSSTGLETELELAGLRVVARHPIEIGAQDRTHWILECEAR